MCVGRRWVCGVMGCGVCAFNVVYIEMKSEKYAVLFFLKRFSAKK